MPLSTSWSYQNKMFCLKKTETTHFEHLKPEHNFLVSQQHFSLKFYQD